MAHTPIQNAPEMSIIMDGRNKRREHQWELEGGQKFGQGHVKGTPSGEGSREEKPLPSSVG